MQPIKVTTLSACIAAIGFVPAVYAADDSTVILDTITVKGTRNKDEIGKNRVYAREIVNLYKGKNEVETFKGNTVSDLLSGMSGVYSGDARNSGALDPNIRGVQGQGRIPVTIDGTEQAITVWRGYAGANNRNYVDPNIISSVSIEKGPSFSRDMKSGIGGSVALKTIDADDIVPEGQQYGFEVKAEAANNSIKRRENAYEHSVDYRTLPVPAVATGGIWRSFFDDTDRIDQRFNGRNKFGEDKAYRIAAATKQDNFDAMLAYAYRSKGNYFSGKKGAERYGYIGPWTMETVNELNRQIADAAARGKKFYGSEAMLGAPDIARIGLFYHPGGEVTNTSLENKSWLGKTTFRLPNRQTLKFGLRHTDSIFGEIMPSRVIGPLFSTPDNLNKIAEWLRAWVKQRSYNIDYSWKPEGNRWIDFYASLWTTRTKSKTNTAGGSPGDAMYEDRTDGVEQLPNTNGRFNTIEGNAYYANNTRNGFNFSNRMKLHDKLTLTLMGDFQNEKLRSRNEFSEELSHDGLDKYREEIEASQLATNTELTRFGEPRDGRRREWNFGFNFRYQPMSWLTLTAGARYTNFKIQDDNERLKTGFDKYNNPLQVNRGEVFQFTRVATEQEYRDYLNAINNDEFNAARDSIEIDDRGVAILNPQPHNDENRPRLDKLKYYWRKDDRGRLNPADNPWFTVSDLHSQTVNPAYDPNDPDSLRTVQKYTFMPRSDKIYRSPITPAELQRAHKQGGSGWAPAFSAAVNFTDNARAYNGYLASMVQPRWSVDADLGGRFFHNKLESGIRFHYHSRFYQNRRTVWQAYYDQLNRINDYNLQADTDTMRWQPVAYLRYKIGKNLTAELVGSNLTNRYYLDPMSRSYLPAPGRTIRIGITGKW